MKNSSPHSFIKTAVLTAGLMIATAHSAFAASYAEVGDAGNIVSGLPQLVTGTPGDTITSITGALTLSANISEVDAYQIYISSPATFSATTTGFAPGVNSFDTQLFLFTQSGIGIVGNDDDTATGAAQSTIPAGSSFTSALAPGYYYLVISGSGQFPASPGGVIFKNWTDGTTDPTGVYGPAGPGGGSPISSYFGSSNEGGAYSIALTGVTIAAVPEPSPLALGLAGALALLALRRRR
jgi:MYXO-CTERM domain-containing protein